MKKQEKKRRVRSTKAQRARALEMIREGASDETIAKELKITVGAVTRVRRKGGSAGPSAKPVEAPSLQSSSASGPAGADYREDGGLDRALLAAGLGGESLPPEEEGGAASPAPESQAEDEPTGKHKVPPPSPKAIVALARGLRHATVKGASSVYRSPLTEDKDAMKRLTEIPPEERELLMMFAPYLAEEMPALMENAPKLAIFGFVGIFAVGTFAAVMELRGAAKEHREREANARRWDRATPTPAEPVVEEPAEEPTPVNFGQGTGHVFSPKATEGAENGA